MLMEKPYKLASRGFRATPTTVRLGAAVVGGDDLVVMAGPCTVETREQLLETAQGRGRPRGPRAARGGLQAPLVAVHLPGPGRGGAAPACGRRRQRFGLPVVTEVMEPGTVELVCEHADVLQIGARNCQNYPLLREVGRVEQPVLLKRGPGCTVEEWIMAAEHIMAQGNMQVMLCERGIKTFETATRYTLDLSAIPVVKRLTHLPVVVDPSHGTGKWYLVKPMCLAAIAAGADGLLVEVHPTPDTALCDGAQSLTIESFGACMDAIRQVAAAVGRRVPDAALVGASWLVA